MKRALIFLFFLWAFSIAGIRAQTLTKEAMNSFAIYTDKQDIKQLEKARKQIDEAYKTSKDSVSNKNNLIRGLVYSTLARVDSNRAFSYKKDPIAETRFSLKQIKSSKFINAHSIEFSYIKNQLTKAYVKSANKALLYYNYIDALKAFTSADSLQPGNISISHNLAVLNEKLGNLPKAIEFYQFLILNRDQPQYHLALANLYESMGQQDNMLKVLKTGSVKFLDNKDLTFKLLNVLAEKKDYKAITAFIKDFMKVDEYNLDLNYLAGFSYEMIGEENKAKEYYQQVLTIDPNNYVGNYALGLFYLNSYLHNIDKSDFMYMAKHYLSKSNEIDPNDFKTLHSLAILYKNNGDSLQLKKVRNKINQLK